MNVEEAESSSQPSDPVRPYGGACDTCRRRRVKCDGNQPCQRCMKSNVVCTYGSMAGRTSAISYARRLEEQIAQLQTLLQGQTQLQPGKLSQRIFGQSQLFNTMIQLPRKSPSKTTPST